MSCHVLLLMINFHQHKKNMRDSILKKKEEKQRKEYIYTHFFFLKKNSLCISVILNI